MAKHSMGDWQAETLRLSAFLVQPIVPAEMRFWEPLVGRAPDEVSSRPQQQLVMEQGPLLTGRISVEARNNRIDWRLFPDLGNHPHALPAVGPYEIREQDFRKLMQRWLNDCPPVHRLAYGGVLLHSTESLTDAYRRLDDLLPGVDVDPENTQDFTYRINRRRASHRSIQELTINRISTWSADQVVETLVEPYAAGQYTPRVTQMPGRVSFCRLELDINTAPEFGHAFDKNAVLNIFDELVDLGNEIATRGDVP